MCVRNRRCISICVQPPERLEYAIKRRQLFMSMNEQGAADVIDIVALPHVDLLECISQIDNATGVHVKPGAPQQPLEDDQVVDQGAHGNWCAEMSRDSEAVDSIC